MKHVQLNHNETKNYSEQLEWFMSWGPITDFIRIFKRQKQLITERVYEPG